MRSTMDDLHADIPEFCNDPYCISINWFTLQMLHFDFRNLAIIYLVQDCMNSISNALGLLQFCAKPSMWCKMNHNVQCYFFCRCPFLHDAFLMVSNAPVWLAIIFTHVAGSSCIVCWYSAATNICRHSSIWWLIFTRGSMNEQVSR